MRKTRTVCDSGHRFIFENAGVRGQIVHLDSVWQEVQRRTSYPLSLRTVLGEASAAAALLAATLKFDGRLSLQLNAVGPVHLLLAQATSANGLRALAHWQQELPAAAALPELFTDGRLTLSIDAGTGQPYVGTVPLNGPRLQDAVDSYFQVSEQLATRVWLHASDQVAAGLLLQRLPSTDTESDDWVRLCLQAGTVRPEEISAIGATALLQRLFPEDDVRLFAPRTLRFECSCSTERSAYILRQLGTAELQDIIKSGEPITVTCEFCGAPYHFDAVDCAQLIEPVPFESASPTRH